MRGGIVVAGVLLMLIGLFGWMMVFFNILIGAVLFCLAVPIFFAGLIVFIIGIAMSPPQQQVIVVTQQAPGTAMTGTCPVCGRHMVYYSQNGRWYCSNCRTYRT